MANKLAYVTGDREVDAILAQFEPKFQKKYGRKASRNAAKKVMTEAKAKAPEDTGALKRSLIIRTAKRSRKIAFGHRVIIDRDRLIKYAGKFGKKISKDKKRNNEPFFYPSVIEFGDKDTPAQKPLRNALFGNEAAIKSYFLDELKAQIRETKPLTK